MSVMCVMAFSGRRDPSARIPAHQKKGGYTPARARERGTMSTDDSRPRPHPNDVLLRFLAVCDARGLHRGSPAATFNAMRAKMPDLRPGDLVASAFHARAVASTLRGIAHRLEQPRRRRRSAPPPDKITVVVAAPPEPVRGSHRSPELNAAIAEARVIVERSRRSDG
jgi:hypothetical protein